MYLAGGSFGDHSDSREMWCYDASHDSWLQMASMNEARSDLGNIFYFEVSAMGCCLGEASAIRSDQVCFVSFLSFNMVTWSLGLVTVGGYVFAVGGIRDGRWESVERYDPTSNTWELVESARLPEHQRGCSVALDGLIYIIEGVYEGNLRKVHKYNPETSVWKEVASLHSSASSLCVLKGKIYVMGNSSCH